MVTFDNSSTAAFDRLRYISVEHTLLLVSYFVYDDNIDNIEHSTAARGAACWVVICYLLCLLENSWGNILVVAIPRKLRGT